jgi:hypothetical protein
MVNKSKKAALYKLYGYIISPIDVVDFVPVIFTKGGNYYLAESKDGIINDFVKIEVAEHDTEDNIAITYIPKQNIIETNIIETRLKGQNTLYCYQGPDNQTRIGEFSDLTSDLSKLLKQKVCNEFANLSIAKFLGLTGIRFQIIKAINNEYRKRHMNFRMSEPDIDQFVDIKTLDELDEVIKQTGMQVNLDPDFGWNDLMYIYKNYVLIRDRKIRYKAFKKHYLAFDVLEIFFSNSGRATDTIVENNEVFHDALRNEMIPAVDDEKDFARCYWLEKGYTSSPDSQTSDDFTTEETENKKNKYKKYRLALQAD